MDSSYDACVSDLDDSLSNTSEVSAQERAELKYHLADPTIFNNEEETF